MGQLETIAGIYEIREVIGSGGFGTVYKGWHTRLKKDVVLKMERRRGGHSRASKPEAMEQEVTVLKNLSHTYIPQVYDFIEAEDATYTVMDYIQGDSLDRLLQPPEGAPATETPRIEQARVVKWACELLEALVYLHSQGILHSDIKPANIMVTPNDDIRLIDFNVSLALGDPSAFRVGRSPGYAPPEQSPEGTRRGAAATASASQTGSASSSSASSSYASASSYKSEAPSVGRSYILGDPEAAKNARKKRRGTASRTGTGSGSYSSYPCYGGFLDARSDVYSLGATLYHVVTGTRPDKQADRVVPLDRFRNLNISPAVAAIITKAMAPEPIDRYQSAQDMLTAFLRLHHDDPRARRHRRRMALTAAACFLILLAGGGATFIGLRQMERTKNALALAEYSADALREGDVDRAVSLAMEALPENPGLLDPPYTPQAQRALANALGVYDYMDGWKPSAILELPGTPQNAKLSPDGSRAASLADNRVLVFDTETGRQIASLDAEPSPLSSLAFRDNETLLYAGTDGLTAYNLDTGETLWSTGAPATGIALSADGTVAATVYRDAGEALVFRTDTGERIAVVSFQGKRQLVASNDMFSDAEGVLFALDSKGSWLIASFEDGGLTLFDLWKDGEAIPIADSSDYSYFEGGFSGNLLAFSACQTNGESLFQIYDLSDRYRIEQMASASSGTLLHAYAGARGICLSSDNLLVSLDPETLEQTELAYTSSNITHFTFSENKTLVLTRDGSCLVYDANAVPVADVTRESVITYADIAGDYILQANRDAASLQILQSERRSDAHLFSYDSSYSHTEARVHTDRETALLFSTDGFRVINRDGTILADETLPNSREIFDQEYLRTEDGDKLEVIYNDGTRRFYSAEYGILLAEEAGDVPDRTLHQRHETEDYLVEFDYGETPHIYDKATGNLLGTLDIEGTYWFAYATQVDDKLLIQYNLTEYENGDFLRRAVLLDRTCGILADLPGLTDILPDTTLVFDDGLGSLRQGKLYTLEELMMAAKEREAQRT